MHFRSLVGNENFFDLFVVHFHGVVDGGPPEAVGLVRIHAPVLQQHLDDVQVSAGGGSGEGRSPEAVGVAVDVDLVLEPRVEGQGSHSRRVALFASPDQGLQQRGRIHRV